MPTPTYDLISSQVLSSDASSVTFSSLPTTTYRDLVLVASQKQGASGTTQPQIRFNGDGSSSGYFSVLLETNGSSTYSNTYNGFNQILFAYNLGTINTTNSNTLIINFMDYRATDKHKLVLARNSNPSAGQELVAGRWANTSAITSFELIASAAAGSTFHLYGIVS